MTQKASMNSPSFVFFLFLFLEFVHFSHGAEFVPHGLFWSVTPNKTVSISRQNQWIPVDDSPSSLLVFSLQHESTVTFSYHASVEGYRVSNLGMPLPREAKDFLQMRCVVDDSPLKRSGSHTSSFLVEPRKVGSLGAVFAMDLPEGNHSAFLEWRKVGSGIQKWSTLASVDNGINTGFSLIVSTDHERVFHLQDSNPASLVPSGKWHSLGEELALSLSRKSIVHFQYSLSVSPEMSTTFVKDRNQEFVNTRLAVNGVGYREGSLVHGASTWNPSSSSLTGFLSLTLPPGNHTARLQWKRSGRVFQSWMSHPSFLDGYASNRNIIASIEKIEIPTLQSHERAIVHGDGRWHTVGNKVLSFFLVKESAVHVSYGLPISQYGNPNFDANVWKSLNDIHARLVVDGIGYRYSSSMVSGSSRSMDAMFGNLGLTLPPGSHTVALQWKADKHDWTTLNGIEDGFSQGEQLLVLISSENANPVLKHPNIYEGDEDKILSLSSLSVEDVDSLLVTGMKMRIQLSVLYGHLRLPEKERFSDRLLADDEKFVVSQAFDLNDTISDINSFLTYLSYIPSPDWFGVDILSINVSDLGNVGTGHALSSFANVSIQINNVDDAFTLESPSQLVVQEGGSVTLGQIELNDIDSQTSVFRAQFTVFCGYLSLLPEVAEMRNELTFTIGDGNADSILEIAAPYHAMRSVLSKLSYSARSSCNRNQHVEALSVRVMDTSNYMYNVTRMIDISILPVNSQPEVQMLNLPRWSISGIHLVGEDDSAVSNFNVEQFPTNSGNIQTVSVSSTPSFSVASPAEVSALGEAAVFRGPNNETYSLSVLYSHTKLNVAAYNAVPLGSAAEVVLSVDSDLTFKQEMVECFLGDMAFPAVINYTSRTLACTILANVQSSSETILWLHVEGTLIDDLDYSSNLIPIFSQRIPFIKTIFPLCVILSSLSELRMVVENPLSVEVCIIGGIVVPASVQDQTVVCTMPLLETSEEPTSLSVQVARGDGAFLSNSINVSIIPDPEISSVFLRHEAETSYVVATYELERGSCSVLNLPPPLCKTSSNSIERPFFVSESEVFCAVRIPQKDHIIMSLETEPPLRSDTQFTLLLSTDSGGFVKDLRYLVLETPRDIVPDLRIEAICGSDDDNCSVHSNFPQSDFDRVANISTTQSFNITIASSAWDYALWLHVPFESGKVIFEDHNVDVVFPIQLQYGEFETPVHFTYGGDLLEFQESSELESSNYLFVSSVSLLSMKKGYILRVFGGVFLEHSVYSCVFLENSDAILVSDATVESPTELLCTIPSDFASRAYVRHDATDSASAVFSIPNVTEGIEDALWATNVEGVDLTSSLYLMGYGNSKPYHDYNISVSNISPRVVPMLGGTKLIANGSGFSALYDLASNLFCQFGRTSVPAQVVSDREVTCTVPSGTSKSTVEFFLKLSDNSFKSTSFVLSYVSDVFLTQIHPKHGTRLGGSRVVISGILFPVLSEVRCIFGEEFVSARMLNATLVECRTPPGSVGAVSVGLDIDGTQVIEENLVFHYVEDVVVKDFSPITSSTDGGRNVTITGSGFSSYNWLSCLFGESEMPGIYVSDSVIRCETPAHAVGSVDLVLRLGSGVVVKAPSSFTFVTAPVVESVSPSVGPVSGGTVVTITGQGFDFSDNVTVFCSFGDKLVEASAISSTLLNCTSPMSGVGGDVNFRVLFEPYFWSRAFSFSYVTLPLIVSSGFERKDDIVKFTFFGLLLSSHESYVCVLSNSSRVNADFMSSNYIECSFDSANFSSFDDGLLSLENGHGEVLWETNVSLKNDLVIQSVSTTYLDSFVAILNFSPYTLSSQFSYECIASGEICRSIVLNDFQLACDISQVYLRAVVELRVVEMPTGILSPSVSIEGVAESVWNGEKYVDTVDPEVGEQFGDDVSAPSQSKQSYHLRWFDLARKVQSFHSSISNPESVSAISRRSNHKYKFGSSIIGSGFGVDASTCFLDSTTPCTDSPLSMEKYFYALINDTSSHFAKEKGFLPQVIDDVSSLVIDPFNGTWIDVRGRYYSNSTKCLINGKETTTLFYSSELLQCYVPSANNIEGPTVLATHDASGKLSSDNEIFLYYDIMEVLFDYKDSESSQSVHSITMSSGDDTEVSEAWCGSLIGCKSSHTPFAARFDGWYQWAANNPAHPLDWGRFDNISASHIDPFGNVQYDLSQFSAKEDFEFPENSDMQAYFMDPTEFVHNQSSQLLYFYGSKFDKDVMWCCRIESETLYARFVSSTEIQCPLSVSWSPGVYQIELMRDCSESVGVFNLTVLDSWEVVADNVSVYVYDDVDGVINDHSFRVSSVWPLSGSLSGGTMITISGYQIVEATACKFESIDKYGNYETQQIVPTFLLSNEKNNHTVGCSTDEFLATGQTLLSILHNNQSWIETGFHFYVYLPPIIEVAYRDVIGPDETHYIVVLGSNFETMLGVFGRVDFVDTNFTALQGRVVDSQYIRFPIESFWSSDVQAIHVSFNGVDYIDANFVSTRERLGIDSDNLQIEYNATLSTVLKQNEIRLLRENEDSFIAIEPITTLFRDAVCDGTQYVRIMPSYPVSPTDQVSCNIESMSLNASFTQSGDVICYLPEMSPGIYEVKLMKENYPSRVSSSMQIRCVHRPVVLSAFMEGRSISDGSHNLILKGFHLEQVLDVECYLGKHYTVPSIQSSRTISCNFPPMSPTLAVIGVRMGQMTTIFEVKSCISESILLVGGELAATNADESKDCKFHTSAVQSDIVPNEKTMQGVSFWPHVTLAGTNAGIEITADNITSRHVYFCVFGGSEVSPAFFVALNRLLCYTPLFEPSTVGLFVNSSLGDMWEFGSIQFISPIKILTVTSQSSIRPGNALIKVMIAENEDLQDVDGFFCHLGSDIYPAHFATASQVVCIADISRGIRNITLSLGSEVESWSNEVVFSLEDHFLDEKAAVFPKFGTVDGGTEVHINISSRAVREDDRFQCFFQGIASIEARKEYFGNIIHLVCISPPGLEGLIQLNIQKTSQSHDVVTLGSSSYTYLRPAVVAEVFPKKIMQGLHFNGSKASKEIFLRGANFFDSEHIQCIVNNTLWLPGRWYANDLMSCEIPLDLTVAAEPLFLKASNNGIDKFHGEAVLNISPREVALDVYPLIGYTRGGSSLEIRLLDQIVDLSLYCQFRTQNVHAYRDDNGVYFCIVPPSSAGKEAVSIVLDSSVVSSFVFEYVAEPTLLKVSPQVLLSSFENIVTFHGQGFSRNTIGRFRRESGAVKNAMCEVNSSTVMFCAVTPFIGDSVLFFDVSINGIDYINDFAVVKLQEPTKIISLHMPPVYRNGGGRASFKVSNAHSQAESFCVFNEIGSAPTISPVLATENELSCAFPYFESSSAQISVKQHDFIIYGPIDISVKTMPTVSEVFPSRFESGKGTSVSVTFSNSGDLLWDYLVCLFDNERYPLQMLSANTGTCVLHPLRSGVYSLSLFYTDNVNATIVAHPEMMVFDRVDDVSFNTTSILSFERNFISAMSESCTLPPSFCQQDSNEPTDPVVMTPCEIVCDIKPYDKGKVNSASLKLSTVGSSDSPYLVKTLAVYGPAVVAGCHPPSGSTLGGDVLQIAGVGFPDSGLVQCAFDDVAVTAAFISSSLLRCVTPSSPPKTVTVNILHDSHQISRSTIQYEFISLTPILNLSSQSIFSIGGSVLDITVAEMSPFEKYSFQCKFTNIVVDASPLTDSVLRCITPALNFELVDFALLKKGAVVSSTHSLNVFTPPAVVLVEPMAVPAHVPVQFTILFGDALKLNEAELKCKIGGIITTASIYNALVVCDIPVPGVSPGLHSLQLSIDGVEFYSVKIVCRVPLVVNRVTPRIGFALQESTIHIHTVSEIERSSHVKCCFDMGSGDDFVLKPAILTGPNRWGCSSPKIENNATRLAAVGIQGPDGICEPTSFHFKFVPFPDVLSVQPLEGPYSGGSVVSIQLSKPLPVDVAVKCRIGVESFYTERTDPYSVQCVTRQSRVGVNFIELSVNGIDFLHIPGFKFEYKALVLNQNASSSDDSTFPFVYNLSPDAVSSSRPEEIRFYGTGFELGSYCFMNDATKLESIFISESILQCLSPIHPPGKVQLSVVNPSSGLKSKSIEMTFLAGMSRLSVSLDGGVSPNHGPRTGGTAISISGYNFDSSDKALLCRIGDDYVFASVVSSNTLKCITPANSFSGFVKIQIATEDREFFPGTTRFEYIEDPILIDSQPSYGSVGTLVQVTGKGFNRNIGLECLFGDSAGETVVLSDTVVTCLVPILHPSQYLLTVRTNGQQIVRSGLKFEFINYVELDSLSPVNGPALRGNTILTVHGSGFVDSIDLRCVLGDEYSSVPAVFLSSQMVRCRLPSHKPGLVNISIYSEGTRLHAPDNFLEFMYNPDVSVDKITPEFGYTSGGYPVFVFGSNFINTSFLGCKFGDMRSRGLFLSNTSIICLAPSPLGRAALQSNTVKVDVTVNGLDYSENGIEFEYSEPCDEGWFCPGMTRQLCPNGTYCPINSRNFTLCPPGSFQPKEGQVNCASCPVGYICPDHGMPRPVICPAGQICDTQGLRASPKNCPMGHYCLNGTKASSASEFQNNTRDNSTNLWNVDYVTGVVTFNTSAVNWDYVTWEAPAVGRSRVAHPPEASCDGMVCTPGTTSPIAEAPYPCPIGHYCRAGVGAQFPIPKNFSMPQRCFDGFFCPRGSINPEGKGPCPTGFFCPTQLDAISCPRGHYCPGVGNRGPVECYPGTYNPSEQRSNCTVCPTGHVCPGWGSLLPELCPAGFVCTALGLSYPVVLCPAGYLCKDGTVTLDPSDPSDNKPIPCDAGTFCLGGVSRTVKIAWIPNQPWGANTPQACSEGTYCKSGAYEPSGSGQCFQGHYCPPNLAFPIETPIGNFAFEEGAVAPTLCFPGTYAPLKAQISCLPCPAGHGCTSYGTYIPTICAPGTFRATVDSISCRLCLTGTYSDEYGAVDVSMCLPCPEGRVCGIQGINSLSLSTVCPAGYVCGFGTDRTRQFLHKAPAGYHTQQQTIPSKQYDSTCLAGFYCVRGTSTALALRAKCGVGYFCPEGTPTPTGQEVKCPRTTTSLSGVDQVNDCRIADVDVCDKAQYDIRYPMQDLTYYPSFSYTSIDGEDEEIVFDSSTTAINPTGEVVVTTKVYSINESTSSPFWVNDTIEVFRTCPSYGSAAYDVDNRVQIIGRNFRDSGMIYCRWRVCLSADEGKYPKRCRNRGTSIDSTPLPYAGEMEDGVRITMGTFISKYRVACDVPKFKFGEGISDILNGKCEYVDNDGFLRDNAQEGNLSYIRACGDPLDCLNLPNEGEEYFQTLSFACSSAEILAGYCTNTPENEHMFNPCFTQELLVEVTNNAHSYSGGNDLEGITINATVVPPEKQTIGYKNYFIPPTFAEFTYVMEDYWYDDPEVLNMEREYCNIPRYAEEYPREREKGWFRLRANEVAHIHIDLKHIPEYLVYGEHYRFALFITPSRCTDEVCNDNRVRLAPQENVPCKQPKEFSEWFLDTSVQKNTTNNITVYAMDDLLFKVEVHITLGLFAPFEDHFENTTTVRIAYPHRARVTDGVKHPAVRKLSPYVSFEEEMVTVYYMFGVVYMREFSDSISMPLNLPPRGEEYARGRAIVSYNKSQDSVHIPDILDTYSRIAVGPNFWDTLAATTLEAKEIYDAYFEVFHGMTYSGGVYEESFTQFLSPHMLFFSNCRTFDSYIPMWLLLEGKECELPDEEEMGADWPRFEYPALPNQDDITVVGPWDFLQDPIADYCGRSLTCQYEEMLDTLDVVPRWFEAASGDELFSVIREPVDYFDLTGRPNGARISKDDVGSGDAISNIVVTDIFKSVTVDREAANDYPGGCTLNCYPREMTLDIGYYQFDKRVKRIIYINLIYDSFDYDSEFTEYTLGVDYYPLGYFDLIVNFAFEAEIFVILFVFVGGVTVALAFVYWIVVRIFTSLQNPPELRIFNMFTLIAPPPTAGVTLALIPVGALTMAAYYLISGDRLQNENAEVGNWYLDDLQLEYVNIGGRLDPNEQERARNGRLGVSFCIIAFFCCFAGTKIFLPKKVSKRENEIALKRDKMAEKESIWAPTLWKRSNLMFCSILMGLFLVMIVEFSYWGDFGTYVWWCVLMLKVFAHFIDALVEHQLKEKLLVAPVSTALAITQALVTLGADDFVDFVLVYFVEMALLVVERVYIEPFLNEFLDWMGQTSERVITWIKSRLPKYLQKKKNKTQEAIDYRKRDVDDDVGDDDAETVEPILDSFLNVCMDTMSMYYTVFLIYLLMLFREEIVLPSLYGIAEQDMLYYLYFSIVIIFFLFIQDILIHSACELFHGWKIYEYLVYTRYRFLQRETRWKGMETSLDECIDEGMRTLDQMCFSSQFFLMLTIHTNGIIYIVLGVEMMLRAEYNAFADTALVFILLYLIACYVFLEKFIMWFVVKIKLWKIKHENTSWHLQLDEEDDLDVPAWEDAKGASHDAYLMNQRITSETFRYKFLNYNRAWLIQQLPQLLTPRTLRRSRPYLINQFARIINSRRDDISDDSEDDAKKKFGPVALSSSSRNIIRFWLDRARRRLRLKQIVDPLIRQARGSECEQCLSRKQLTTEYEIDMDQMMAMYDNLHPNETEIDQVEWKRFWKKNQHYHTICMVCIAKRKDDSRNKKRDKRDKYEDFDDPTQEEYPDWGPVFLSAASKAILINWYRKAQKLRASKKGRQQKKMPKAISDDEGDDVPRAFGESMKPVTPATQAIAIKWMRTARARLQKKGGKGSAALPLAQAVSLKNTFKKSGNKSKIRKK